jgi:hypothetical protein
MRTISNVTYLVCLLLASAASGTELSATNSEVYYAIEGASDTNSVIQCDNKLVWSAFSTSVPIELNYPNVEYGIKIKMTAPDGSVVKKTELGSQYGTRFDRVKKPEDAFPRRHLGCIMAERWYDARGGPMSGPLLPAPRDLFAMKNPGIYRLEIEMMFFRVNRGTNGFSRDILRYPPVTLKVKKDK